MKQNSFPLRDWHVKHMEQTVVRFVKGLSENATRWEVRLNKKYGKIAQVFREQIQAAAGIFRRTLWPLACSSPVNRCDQNNASSFFDSQFVRVAIQSFAGRRPGL